MMDGCNADKTLYTGEMAHYNLFNLLARRKSDFSVAGTGFISRIPNNFNPCDLEYLSLLLLYTIGVGMFVITLKKEYKKRLPNSHVLLFIYFIFCCRLCFIV